jgi:hypothetical protein
VDAVDVTAGKVQHLSLKGNGSWVSRRAKAQLHARGLGTELTADVDLPVDALRQKRHEPVTAHVAMPTFDVAQVVCTAVRMKLITTGCAQDKAEVTGSAELKRGSVRLRRRAGAEGRGQHARGAYRKLPPTDLTVEVDGPEKGNLSVSAKGTALHGTIDVQASVGRSLRGSSRRPPGRDATDRDAHGPGAHRRAAAQAAARGRAGPARRRGSGLLDADVAGTVSAPSGELKLQGQQLQTPPMDPTDVTSGRGHKAIDATINARDSRGELATLNLDVAASPTSLQTRKTFDDVAVNLDGRFGPLELSRLPIIIGEGRQARRLRGSVLATVQGRGTLQAPTLVATLSSEQLGAGQTPLGKAVVKLNYREAKTQLLAGLSSINGGMLNVDVRTDLDLSYPALRKGLKPTTAPFEARVTAQSFDLAFLNGFTTTLRKVTGTLDIDARATGTVGAPKDWEARVERRDARAVRLWRVPAGASAGEREQRPRLPGRSRGPHRLRVLEADRARHA